MLSQISFLVATGSVCAEKPAFPPALCKQPPDSEFLVLEQETDQPLRSYGKSVPAQLNAASTVKLALALALLDDGYSPDTLIEVEDPHIPGTPRKINLSEALLYSSNDYFRSLARQKGLAFFRASVDRMGFYPQPLSSNWPGSIDAIAYGGNATTDPTSQLRFMIRILSREGGSEATLRPLIRWPMSPDDMDRYPALSLYGKTGAWNRTVWFVGGARIETQAGPLWKAMVLVRRGHWKLRNQAIRNFYCRMGLELPDHPLTRTAIPEAADK